MAARENMLDILRPGDVIKDKWRILRMIGKGGFGQIFETEYIKSEEKAAMKVESCHLSRQVNTRNFKSNELGFSGFENGSRSSQSTAVQIELRVQVLRLRKRRKIQLHYHESPRQEHNNT